jgi:pimeloyl-ACP methyl ester carboxylesterase
MSEQVQVEGLGSIEVALSERGKGQPVLLLHGGAGPQSVMAWAELLARTRPELVRKLGLDGVTVIGNSVGGWIAAEMALAAPQLVRKLVLVDAGGIDVPGHFVADVFALSPQELTRLSYHDPERFAIDFSKLTPEQRAGALANRATLKAYGGDKVDAQLRGRLQAVVTPTLAVWGEADRIVDSEYGRAYAQAIPKARFELLAGAGHLPQIETPQLLIDTIWPFIAE